MVMAAKTKLTNPKTLTDLNAMPLATEENTSVEPLEGGEESIANPSSAAEKTSEVVESEAVTDIQKKMKRAERFGMPMHLSEEEKRNTRAERFGTVPTAGGSQTLNQSEALKRKARAERFGISQSTPVNDDAKKKARLERFHPSATVDAAEEDKKKARALRFAKPNAKENGREIITAVPEKAV